MKLLINGGVPVKGAKVGVLGLTFKEDCTDLRNSKVPDILTELRTFGIEAKIHDPVASAKEAVHEYGLTSSARSRSCTGLDALVLAVSHKAYLEMGGEELAKRIVPGGILIDVKSALGPAKLPASITYWSL